MTDALFPFQEAIVDAVAASPAKFVAVDTGLGKSRCVIEAAKRVRARNVLVPCPAIGKVSWPAEIEKWWPEASVLVPSEPALLTQHPNRPTFNVVSYDDLARDPQRWLDEVRRLDPDVVAPDEAQFLKNLDATRTKVVYGRRADRKGSLIERARFVWPLSGTPAPNYTAELWTHIHALAPHTILNGAGRPMSEAEFQDRFSTKRASTHGMHVTGSINTPALRARTAEFFYRLRKREVLTDMPEIVWTHEPIPMADAGRWLDNVPADLSDDDMLEWLRANFPHGSSERKALGLAKVGGAAEWARNFIDGADADRKLIMFGYHTEVVERLTAELAPYGVVMIHGGIGLASRKRAVDLFQHDPATRIFIGEMLACGTSITLTAASDVAFVEGDWTPTNLAQAAARADRLGQTRGVVARLLYVPRSKDERIARVAARKARELSVMFDGEQAIAA
jgi:SWI/SNF-related matrix-associated actin-dependent regulator 1 of chromatin subfamily A